MAVNIQIYHFILFKVKSHCGISVVRDTQKYLNSVIPLAAELVRYSQLHNIIQIYSMTLMEQE